MRQVNRMQAGLSLPCLFLPPQGIRMPPYGCHERQWLTFGLSSSHLFGW